MSEYVDSTKWDSKRLVAIFSEVKIKNLNNTEQEILQFRYGEIVSKKNQISDDDSANTYSNYTVLLPGDIVINGLNLNYDFVTQRVGRVKKSGIITSAYIALRPREEINANYYCYFLKALDSKKILNGMGTGIRRTLSFKELRNMQMLYPPREEQDQIVRYLDWQVSRFNKLIAAKKKQVRLLIEQKKAIINGSVTKGITNIKALQERISQNEDRAPEHWEFLPLCSIAKISKSFNPGNVELLSVYLDEGVIPFAQKVQKRTNPTSLDLSKYQYVSYGDLVLNNQQAWRGSVGVSSFRGIVSPAYIVLNLSDRVDINYANYLFRSRSMVYQYGLASKGVGSIQRNLYWPFIRRVKIALPPLAEQERIAKYLREYEALIDGIITKASDSIELLTELCSRIVSDVVMGRKNVQQIEVPEYEDVDDETDEIFELDDHEADWSDEEEEGWL